MNGQKFNLCVSDGTNGTSGTSPTSPTGASVYAYVELIVHVNSVPCTHTRWHRAQQAFLNTYVN